MVEKGNTKASQAIQALQDKFDFIEKEVYCLVKYRHVYIEVINIIAKNGTARQPSTFHDLFRDSYIAFAVSSVRRLGSRRRDDISLRNLICEIKKRKDMIPPDRFNDLLYDYPVKTMDGNQANIPESIINRDLERLENSIKSIKDFADQYIAHLQPIDIDGPPKFGELDEAIDCLEKLTIRYGHILMERGIKENMLPTWQYRWEQIFYAPWLKNPRKSR